MTTEQLEFRVNAE